VFCSEWGTSSHTGDGGPYPEKADEWLAFLDERGISWVNWSLCNKRESSAALTGPLVPEVTGPEGFRIWPPGQLSASGAYVRARLRRR
jgi:endoglucanase